MADHGGGQARLGRWLDRSWHLLALTSALYFLSGNEADNDLWVHVLSGRRILHFGDVPRIDVLSYTAAGSPWFDHEWLAQCIFAWLFDRAGTTWLWLAKGAIGLAAAAALWSTVAARSRVAWIRGSVMLLALAVAARGFAVRPQIFTYLGVAVLLLWLGRDAGAPGGRRAVRDAVAAALAFFLWTNVHGGVVLGLGILALVAVFPPWRGWGGRRLVLGAAVVAACVNPYGPSLFLYVVDELVRAHPLTEWQPVTFAPEHRPFWLLFVLFVTTLPFSRLLRSRSWWPALALAIGLMALRHQRHTPLFALCAAAPLADQLDGANRWLQSRAAVRLTAVPTALLVAALLMLGATQLSLLFLRLDADRYQIVYDAADYPVGAVRFLQVEGIHGNLALPIDWGAFVLWHTSPAIAVSLDGRFATVYPPRVVEDNFAFFRGGDGADRLLDEYPTSLVLAPKGSPVPVRGREGWQLRYSDDVAELFQRAGGGPPPVAGQAPRGRLEFP